VTVTTPRVVVLDHGSGNLRSAQRALEKVGAEVAVTADFDSALAADGLVVPGVGAFAAVMEAMTAINAARLVDLRLAGGRPVLGICVGMQVMFDSGIEHGIDTAGLGEWPGVVEELEAPVIPHMGWNTVEAPAESMLFAGLHDARFYFVHSYAVRNWALTDPQGFTPPLVTWTTHGSPFVAAVENGPLSATQFHPEKSGDAGLTLLEHWVNTLT
jgi:glutamine amidotransferase